LRKFRSGHSISKPDPLASLCFCLTMEPGSLIARAMINAPTILIARRRRAFAVWAVVCV
jgi:hypothetical protein